MPIANTTPNRCPGRLDLDQQQVAYLASLPMPAHSVESHLACELEPGHPGPHAALGQHSFDTMHWAQWTLVASDIRALKDCTAQRIPGDEDEDDNGCVLFADHAGRHSHIPGGFF